MKANEKEAGKNCQLTENCAGFSPTMRTPFDETMHLANTHLVDLIW